MASRFSGKRALLAGGVTNGYTADMDSVRFGRALGIGARHAAKALITAADAAASPNPSATGTSNAKESAARPAASTQARRSGATLGQKAARTTAQVRQTKEGVARGGKRLGEAVWGPFVKLSGVLWLELTGVFFGLFVLTAVAYAWKLLAKLHTLGLSPEEHRNLIFSGVIATVFGYFCISSFIRASRRQRRS